MGRKNKAAVVRRYSDTLAMLGCTKQKREARDEFKIWQYALQIPVIPTCLVWIRVEGPVPHHLIMDEEGNVWRSGHLLDERRLFGKNITKHTKKWKEIDAAMSR